MTGWPGHDAIFGRSGSGKSTLLKALLRGRRRVVIFDPMGEHDGARADSLSDVLAAIRRGWRSDFRVRYVPGPMASLPDALDGLAALVRDCQRPFIDGAETRVVTLAVDELAAAFPNRQAPGSPFGALCSRGRHFGVALIGTSQRPAEVSTTFRGNAGRTFFFSLADHVDVQAASAKLGPAAASRLLSFEAHRYLCAVDGRVLEGRNRLR